MPTIHGHAFTAWSETMALKCTTTGCFPDIKDIKRTSKGHQCWDQFWDFPNSLWVCGMQLRGGRSFDWGCGVWKSSQPGFHGSVCVLKWSLATEARDLCRAITFSNSQDHRGHPTCLNSKFPTVCALGGVHRHESISKHMFHHSCFNLL